MKAANLDANTWFNRNWLRWSEAENPDIRAANKIVSLAGRYRKMYIDKRGPEVASLRPRVLLRLFKMDQKLRKEKLEGNGHPSPIKKTIEQEVKDKIFWIAAYEMIGLSAKQCEKDRGWSLNYGAEIKRRYFDLYREQLYVFCERAWEIGQKVRMRTLGRLLSGAETALSILEAGMKGEEWPPMNPDDPMDENTARKAVTKDQQIIASRWLDALEKFTDASAEPFEHQLVEEEKRKLTEKERDVENMAKIMDLDKTFERDYAEEQKALEDELARQTQEEIERQKTLEKDPN